jgi:hypothetical protein
MRRPSARLQDRRYARSRERQTWCRPPAPRWAAPRAARLWPCRIMHPRYEHDTKRMDWRTCHPVMATAQRVWHVEGPTGILRLAGKKPRQWFTPGGPGASGYAERGPPGELRGDLLHRDGCWFTVHSTAIYTARNALVANGDYESAEGHALRVLDPDLRLVELGGALDEDFLTASDPPTAMPCPWRPLGRKSCWMRPDSSARSSVTSRAPKSSSFAMRLACSPAVWRC